MCHENKNALYLYLLISRRISKTFSNMHLFEINLIHEHGKCLHFLRMSGLELLSFFGKAWANNMVSFHFSQVRIFLIIIFYS